MPRLQFKRFTNPDQEREFPLGSAQVVTLDDATIGLASWDPGWRWTTHLAPIAGTALVPGPPPRLRDLGQAPRRDGRRTERRDPRRVRLRDPSGHDASVVGDKPFVTLEWTSANVVGIGHRRRQRADPRDGAVHGHRELTATLEAMGDARWRDVLGEHNRRMRDLLNRYRGREIDTTGDGFLALFDSASRAVRCGRRWPRTRRPWASRSASASTPARSSSSATGLGPRRACRGPGPGGGRARGPRVGDDEGPDRGFRPRRRGRRAARAQGDLGRAAPVPGAAAARG